VSDYLDVMTSVARDERAAMINATVPRPWNNPRLKNYIPGFLHPKQQAFLIIGGELMPEDVPTSDLPFWQVEEVLYGGAAGGAKSHGLLAAALQFADVPGYAALLLRRSFSDLTLNEALMNKAKEWLFDQDGVRWSAQDKTFYFETGEGEKDASLTFGYLQHEDDKFRYNSAEFQFVGLDELTQFSETQYTFVGSRLRKPVCKRCVAVRAIGHELMHPSFDVEECLTCDGLRNVMELSALMSNPSKQHWPLLAHVPLRQRAASNPGGRGHLWVKRRFIDARNPKRLFIPAKLKDNPSITYASYLPSLMRLDPVTRQQLLDGNWVARPEGMMFQREWFKVGDRIPSDVTRWVRYWDFAATSVSRENQDPDWSAGCLMGATARGTYIIADMRHVRARPQEVEETVAQTARLDTYKVPVVIEQEPGSSGVMVIDHYRRNVLPGFSVTADKVTGSKTQRAMPLSSASEARYVEVLVGTWNESFFDELEMFGMDEDEHDDQVDTAAGAYQRLAVRKSSTLRQIQV
jgi:predicted phage terminase large subunit-like protein